jgi:nucleotide-binding universal stress UspA family protein
MKPFLVALDNSPRAPSVLAAAIRLSKATASKLILFRAVGLPGELPFEAYAMPPEGVIDILKQRAQRELAQTATAIPPGIEFESRVDIGTAWQAICDVAKEVDAAAIVLGSHGYSGIDRLLGTTAARVVNHADRAVIVVRRPELLDPT